MFLLKSDPKFGDIKLYKHFFQQHLWRSQDRLTATQFHSENKLTIYGSFANNKTGLATSRSTDMVKFGKLVKVDDISQ